MTRQKSSTLSRQRRERERVHQARAGGNKLALAYVSLYVDANEQLEDAQTQIDWAIRRAAETGWPLSDVTLGVDIVGTPEQVGGGIAHNLAVNILRYADQHYPRLRARLAGITDDDERRPIRDIALMRTLSASAIDNIHLFVIESY